MLGRGDRVAAGGVHNDHAVLGGGFHVDIVDADSGAPDDLEVLRRLKDRGRHLGLATDDQPVELGDDVDELCLLEAGVDDDLHDPSFGKGFDAAGGDRICDQDFGYAHDGRWVVVLDIRTVGAMAGGFVFVS